MSTIYFWDDSDLAPGSATDTIALEVFWTNPKAVLDLIYGPTRQIQTATPPHDHDEDGGASLYLPILQRSFGRYQQTLELTGIPIGPPSTGSFAAVTEDDTKQVDYTNAKRLDCACICLPGGVKTVRVSVTEYHETSGKAVVLYVALRSLDSVNFKLGVAPEEVRGLISYTTSGTGTRSNQTVSISNLRSLGDVTKDRFVEASLWLASDLDSTTQHLLSDWEIIGTALSDAARATNQSDPVFAPLSVREIKSSLSLISPPLAQKIKQRTNALNIALWGSTPGLMNNGTIDRRRRFRESIGGIHQHQGRMTPQNDGSIIGDGACLKDVQSFAYLTYLGETLPLVAATPPSMDHRPNQGAFLHFTDDRSVGWVQYNFRRSIPAGCGALIIRVAAHPGYQGADAAYDSSQTLLMSCTVTPVAGGSSIVTSMQCGPFRNIIDPLADDFGFVELLPIDNVAYQSNQRLQFANRKGWNKNAEIPTVRQSALKLNSVLYRVSEEIRINLTYPPENPDDTLHETGDFDIKLRFKMQNSAGACDDEAGCLWIACFTANGY